jgi:hypothetical protein
LEELHPLWHLTIASEGGRVDHFPLYDMGMEKDNELLSDSLGEVDDKSREDSWNEAQVLGSRVDVKAIPTTLVLMDKAGRVGYIVSQIVTYVVLIW